jgi:DNA-directed RNA polymerase subunit E'/Rpb7
MVLINYTLSLPFMEIDNINNKEIAKLLLQKMKVLLEGKCVKYGYIKKINKIKNISQGIINTADLSSDVTYSFTMDVDSTNYNVGDTTTISLDLLDTNIGAWISHSEPFTFFIMQTLSTTSLCVGDEVSIKIVMRKCDSNEIHLIGEI